MKQFGLTLAAISTLVATAATPTRGRDPQTAPAPLGRSGFGARLSESDPWAVTARRFAQALAQPTDDATVASMFTDQHVLRRADGAPAELEDLRNAVQSSGWSRTLAYSGSPDQLASDLAAAVASADADPRLREYLTPANEATTRAADVTAIKWLASTLAPRADQPVAVALFFHPPDAARNKPARLTMLLLSGERVGTTLFRVRKAVFGQYDVTP